jgi:hypothetical protein
MNKYVFCFISNRGTRYGYLEANFFEEALEKIKAYIENNKYQLIKLEMFQIHKPFQVDVINDN